MTEPATALTDFLLAGLALVAAGRLWPRRAGPPLVSAPIFFAAFGLAACLGGLWHGFANDGASVLSRLLWWLTVASTGVAAVGLAGVGLEGFGLRTPRQFWPVGVWVALSLAVYAWFDPRFLVTVIATAAGSLVCLAGLTRRWLDGRRPASALAVGGLVMSMAAGVLQQRGLAIHAVHFDHNATYHVILIPALLLFYAGNSRLLRHA